MSKLVYCSKCLREITFRGDLVTSTLLFEVVPYHEECFARDLKSPKTLFLGNQPLNGFSGNFVTFFAMLSSIVWLIIGDSQMKWLSLLAMILVIYRLYSFFRYERHLEK